MSIISLKNETPTDTEIKLFHYAGFYKVEDTKEYSKYVPVYVVNYRQLVQDNEFPKTIEIEKQYVDYTTGITFYHSSETVEAVGNFDGKLIGLINDRIKELGWHI